MASGITFANICRQIYYDGLFLTSGELRLVDRLRYFLLRPLSLFFPRFRFVRFNGLSAECECASGLVTFPKLYHEIRTVLHDTRLARGKGRILDVGAKIGMVSYCCKLVNPELQFTCIEPIRSNFEVLSRNVAFKDACLLNFAVGDESKPSVIFKGPDTNAAADASFTRDHECFVEERVEVRRLDDLLDPAETFDLIKMDIEGSEPAAFKGGRTTLGNTRYLYAEFSLRYHDLYAFFEPLKEPFKLKRIYWLRTDELGSVTDLLFESTTRKSPTSGT